MWEFFCHSATTTYCCVCPSSLSPLCPLLHHHPSPQPTQITLSVIQAAHCCLPSWLNTNLDKSFFITFFSSNFEPMQVAIVFLVAMPLVHRLGKPSDGFNLTLTTARSVPNSRSNVHRYCISTSTTSGSGRSSSISKCVNKRATYTRAFASRRRTPKDAPSSS